MPEPEVIDNQTPTTPTGTDPKPPVDGDQNKNDNQSIPKHRFDEVNTKLKDLEKWKADIEKKQKEAEEAALIEQNKFKELAEQREKENAELKTTLNQTKIDTAIERASAKLGVVDSDAVLKLLNREGITIDENGQVVGVEDKVKALIEEKPYLAGKGSNVTVGTPTNPEGNTSTVKTFKLSQLQDTKFYQENLQEIREAYKAGQIIDDVTPK